VSEHAAAEELPELVDDEAGHPTAVRFGVQGREEFDEVRADDAVEHTRRRRAGNVDDGRHAVPRSGPGGQPGARGFKPSDTSRVNGSKHSVARRGAAPIAGFIVLGIGEALGLVMAGRRRYARRTRSRCVVHRRRPGTGAVASCGVRCGWHPKTTAAAHQKAAEAF